VDGAPAVDSAGLRLSPPAEARVESCRVRRDGSWLFLELPSGNRVIFERWGDSRHGDRGSGASTG
jgi:hypothetical protein